MEFRRFRLMSYWNEHEKNPGEFDFSALDQQITLIEKSSGEISLCLGARQPRWPESHWPDWALKLPQEERYEALYAYIKVVISRYQNKKCIVSYQLENEALNRSFGKNGDFNRSRLRKERRIIAELDPLTPLVMSTSNTYGLPILPPRPDVFGCTFYGVQHKKGAYSHSKIPWWWYWLRAKIIQAMTNRSMFIHELQAEPWGPKAIWEMSRKEQDKSMNLTQLERNITLAKKTKLYPIDLWGGEWWYWRSKNYNDTLITKTVKKSLT